MLIVIDANNGVPIYRQIVEQLRLQAASGRIPPGADLPSTRALSQELGINPMTISKAYVLLEEEGIVTRRPGLPVVVSERSSEAIEREKEDHLRAALEPAALAARQLGMTMKQALSVFRQALSQHTVEEESYK